MKSLLPGGVVRGVAGGVAIEGTVAGVKEGSSSSRKNETMLREENIQNRTVCISSGFHLGKKGRGKRIAIAVCVQGKRGSHM